MYSKEYQPSLGKQKIKEESLYKRERILISSQDAKIQVNGKTRLNFCSNNYLGLSNNQDIIQLIHQGITKPSNLSESNIQDIIKNLEHKISNFLGMEDTMLYAATFDANGGIFDPLFTSEDVIITDEQNNTFITDGVQQNKIDRYSYKNNNLEDLENRLKEISSKNYRFKIIVTDGVFSMDGNIANLKDICDLAEKYNAWVMVDDSHATGFIGETGRGTHEYNKVMGRVDIIVSTLGNDWGRGFISSRKEIIDLLRLNSRPYIPTKSLALAIINSTTKIIDTLLDNNSLAKKVMWNSSYFRKRMKDAGFDIIGSETAIISVMLYDDKLSQEFADKLLEEEIYVIGFFFPVVPKGKARIRMQVSAEHTQEQLDQAVRTFVKIAKEVGVL